MKYNSDPSESTPINIPQLCFGCLFWVLISAVVIAFFGLQSDSGKIHRLGKTTVFRANFHCVLRDDDAMILDSSYFVSDGSIYLFKKDGDVWRLASHTNITKYLKGYKVEHILSERLEKFEEFESHNPFVYNDRFVVVLAWKSESKQAAFVFKRNGDNLD